MEPKIDPEIFNSLVIQNGPPCFTRAGKNGVGSLNENFWSEYIMKRIQIRYTLDENAFYLYHDNNGVWENISNTTLMDQMAEIILRFDLHYASKTTTAFLRNLLARLKGKTEIPSFSYRREKYFIHLKNGMLVYENGKWVLIPFSPDFNSRNQLPVFYRPEMTCDAFLEKLLLPAMPEDDIHTLKLYAGQCLLGVNPSQTFLLLLGTAGGGKSTVVNIIERLIGRWNCDELRTEHLGGRFEIGRFKGKTLLTAKDVTADFLQKAGAKKLKALTGNDTLTLEKKGQNIVGEIAGNFNVIVVSNARLQLKFESDEDAWRRRLLLINYNRPAPKEKIVDFDQYLIETEGSGILNWAIEGASELLKAGGEISRSPEQVQKAEALLRSSDPISFFISHHVRPNPDRTITVSAIVQTYRRFCQHANWPLLSERKIQMQIKDAMFEIYGIEQNKNIISEGHTVRGYRGCCFI